MAKIINALKRIRLKDIIAPIIFLLLLIPSLIFRLLNKIKGRELWLVAEEGQARDNGYHFYKYVREEHPHDYCFYAIKKDSAGCKKVSKLGNIIKWGSLRHWLYYMSASLNISSQKNGNPCPIFWYFMHVALGLYRNRVFLQHGVIKDDLKFAYKKYCKFKYFVCGTKSEYDYVLKKFGYKKNELLLTGLSRWDGLRGYKKADNAKSILIMPTWRKWLGEDRNSVFDKSDFTNTDFFRNWNGLINDRLFIKYIEDNDIHVFFYPHINMMRFLSHFKTTSKNIKIVSPDEDIQEFFKKCDMMITDYTSAAFDFAYLKKPVIYYQFDYSEYRAKQHIEGYYDYNADGFGPVVTERSDVIKEIQKLFKNRGKEYYSRMDIFPNDEQGSSEKIYDNICAHNRRKVLHVIYSLKNGGTEKFLFNLLEGTKNTNENYVVYYGGDNQWSSKLKQLGVKVFSANGGNINRIRVIRKTIKENRIGIVYSYTFYNSVFVLIAAISSGVRKRIVHSHRSEANKKSLKVKTLLARLIITMLATDRLACNKTAGEALYVAHRFTVINNGIDIRDYSYSENTRNVIRSKLGIDEGCVLLGTVGRLDSNKNQLFMLQIVKELKAANKFKLAIIGEGEDEKYLKEKAKEYGIEDEVLFLGGIRNAADYYNAFDVFLLTSLKEGLPYVLIEAQANGLPVFASSSISIEAKINKNYTRIDLRNGIKSWAESISSMKLERVVPSKNIEKYSIEETINQVRCVYEG